MFGRDLSPFSGQGVNVIWNGTTFQPGVDQNYNNLPEDGVLDGALNNSAFAAQSFARGPECRP